MKMISKLVLGGALAIAALVGCGGNSSGGGFTTSVPSGTKLTSLTPQQATQLCSDLDKYAKAAETADLCKLLAVETTAFSFSSTEQPSDATLQMACTQVYNSCLDGGDGGVKTSDSCDPSTFANQPSTCTATVGDVTACTNDTVTATKKEVAVLPDCSSVTAANLISGLAALASQADGGTSMSAACTELESNCDTGASSSSTVGLVTAARRLRK
jgi:hypothetical protein